MRVFLDTNVLVSAFGTRGLCADLVRLVLSEHVLLISEQVLSELARVLTTKLKMPPNAAEELVLFLRDHAEVVAPTAPHAAVFVRDPDDIAILAAAMSGSTDVLVTGDRDLLELAPLPAIVITDPRGFWNLLTRKPA